MEDGLDLNLSCSLEPTGAVFMSADRARPDQALRLNHSYAFIFVARGELALTCERTETRLCAREGFLFHQGTPRTVALRPQRGTEFYALRFRDISGGRRGLLHELSVPTRGLCARPERLTDLLRRYVTEHKRRGSTPWVLYNLLILILCEFCASSGAEGARREESGLETIASMVDAFIAAHYREAITTADVARELRYSSGYLERAYRRERGISVRNAIHMRRIREARAQLLLQRERHVSEIAALCGYADAAYFRRVFKRTTNMTPVRFRSINSARRVEEYNHGRHAGEHAPGRAAEDHARPVPAMEQA